MPLFRRLQKENVPFYAGILFENDLETPIARALSAETVTAPAFSPIDDATYERALALLKKCRRVYVTDFPIADGNRRLADLIDEAKRLGTYQDGAIS